MKYERAGVGVSVVSACVARAVRWWKTDTDTRPPIDQPKVRKPTPAPLCARSRAMTYEVEHRAQMHRWKDVYMYTFYQEDMHMSVM